MGTQYTVIGYTCHYVIKLKLVRVPLQNKHFSLKVHIQTAKKKTERQRDEQEEAEYARRVLFPVSMS